MIFSYHRLNTQARKHGKNTKPATHTRLHEQKDQRKHTLPEISPDRNDPTEEHKCTKCQNSVTRDIITTIPCNKGHNQSHRACLVHASGYKHIGHLANYSCQTCLKQIKQALRPNTHESQPKLDEYTHEQSPKKSSHSNDTQNGTLPRVQRPTRTKTPHPMCNLQQNYTRCLCKIMHGQNRNGDLLLYKLF